MGPRPSSSPPSATARRSLSTPSSFDLSQLEPTVACHPDPGQRKLAKDMGDIKLDRAYIGSCTGGKTSDFLEFARILRGKRVVIDTFGVPATPEICMTSKRPDGETRRLANPPGRRSAVD